MPKGHFDDDALAHVIAKADIEAVAAEWGIIRNAVYQLARNALRHLQRVHYLL